MSQPSSSFSLPTSPTILVTGGCGFIGSALVRYLLSETDARVVTVDKLTYAGSPRNLAGMADHERHTLEVEDIADGAAMRRLFSAYAPDAVVHLAAESHVDRSIEGPGAFIQTNVLGTYTLLEVARDYWTGLPERQRTAFRLLCVSTDEVYGALGADGAFTESTPYDPSSPYSASKAAADHLARAWHRTYGMPTLITNCSNNYGPYQYPEKLIPVVILKALSGAPIPVYGTGMNVRDWLYVDDHVRALYTVLTEGRVGETYNIGGHGERTNLEVVEAICSHLDEVYPRSGGRYRSLVEFVDDRPGHDWRYAIDPTKITSELGWTPRETFESGVQKTVEWYLDHRGWCRAVLEKKQTPHVAQV